MHREKLTLANICGGAVQEKVDRAMEKVARNILDPNTDYDKARVITLKLTFKPDEDDIENVKVSSSVNVKLSDENGVSTEMFMSADINGGNVQIMEHRRGEIRGQLDFSDYGEMDPETGELEEKPMVMDFRKYREG